MASKPQNRRELRRQFDAAEPPDPMEDEAGGLVEDVEDEGVVAPKPKRKAKAPAKSKAKTPKASKPAARMRVVWVVVNDAFKPIATFEYAQKEAADARAAELTAKGKGTHFVQRVKEPMPDDAPGLGAAIPRTAATIPIPPTEPAAVPIEDDLDEDDLDLETEDVDDEEEYEDEE